VLLPGKIELMRFLRSLLLFAIVGGLLVGAAYITIQYEIVDRLVGTFLQWQSYLPLSVDFDQFLVTLVVASVFCIVASLLCSSFILTGLGARIVIARQKYLAQTAQTKRAAANMTIDFERNYERIITLKQMLTKRLDKRVLVQAITQSASRLTNVSQANSAVSLWLLNFETDMMNYEMGFHCDESMFTSKEFPLTEHLFAKVIKSRETFCIDSKGQEIVIIKPDKLSQLGAANSLIVVPLVVEESVLGVLVIFCHPDVLKEYERNKLFYEMFWGELALGLAIAIQGELAIIDRLTGVHNRGYFIKRLIEEVERANRFRLPLTVIMIDIDNFKLVNDTLGHPQGDAVLKIIAKIVKKGVRAIDLVGRYGGEEFIILLPETGHGAEETSAFSAQAAAERIRKAVDDEFCGLQKPLKLTVSVGVVVRRFPEEREFDHRELIRIVDEQLYVAKTAGKNRVSIYQPPDSEASGAS